MSLVNKNLLINIDLLLDKIVARDSDKVADLGCGGFGYFVFPLAKRIGKHGKIYAVDIIKANLENIKKTASLENLSQIETVWGDLEVVGSTKIEDNSLDSVLIVSVLSQADNYVNILKEAKRVLRRDGKMLIVDWNDSKSPFDINPEKRLNKEVLKKTADDLDLQIAEDFPAGKYHYALLLIK